MKFSPIFNSKKIGVYLDNIHTDNRFPSLERNFLSFLSNEFSMFKNFELLLNRNEDVGITVEGYDYLLIIRSGFMIHYLEKFLNDFPSKIDGSCNLVTACLDKTDLSTWRALLLNTKEFNWESDKIKPSEVTKLLQKEIKSTKVLESNECSMYSIMLDNRTETNYHLTLQKLLKLVNFDTHSFFARNTESINKKLINQGPFDHLILPASGLMCFEILRETGIGKEGNKSINIFDVSIGALFIYDYLFNTWDGKDYHKIFQGPFAFLCKAPMNSDRWEKFLDSFGGLNEWLGFFKQVRSEYDFHLHKANALARNFKDKFFINEDRKGNTYFSMSNIFTYWVCALEHPLSTRVKRLNDVLHHLKVNYPDTWVYFLTPRDAFAFDQRRSSDLIQAREFETLEIKQPPWETPMHLMMD